MIRILNPHLSENSCNPFASWQELARFCLEYLVDLSQAESDILQTMPTDLLACVSISDMIPLVFRMDTLESVLYKNVNHFLRCFPVGMIGKFMGELKGILH
jgi:hypothetical protein